MKTILGLTMAMVLAATGCGATAMPRPVQSDVAIDIDTGPGGARYYQLGQPIDVDSMKKQLANDKATEGYVDRALALKIIGILAAGAGGAMIGWPIGQKIGGSREPNWTLAGAGAGVALSGLALSVGSMVSLDAAVGVHNERLKTGAASLPGPRRVGEAPRFDVWVSPAGVVVGGRWRP